ncbi:MAG: glycoside hydrolase family 9 protein, partial [Cyclobacteriaceae bacterium]|nr:glycoside hydrolase family 9 protein [Cyclobacteriaceae bacterium]
MKKILVFLSIFASHFLIAQQEQNSKELFIRVNQLGYHANEGKIAVVFSNNPVKEKFNLISAKDQQTKATIKPIRSEAEGWGTFKYYYNLDFSKVGTEGSYLLKGVKSGQKSSVFTISTTAYQSTTDDLLTFMQQQRCGYNPFLDIVCHQKDGRSFYGKMPDSTYVDVSGGWHDAGDQLKYLITGSYATAHMLMA